MKKIEQSKNSFALSLRNMDSPMHERVKRAN